MIFTIPSPPDFNAEECLWFLNRHFDECIYQIADHRIRRAFDWKGSIVLVQISFATNSLIVEVLSGEYDDGLVIFLTEFISEWFDLSVELSDFSEKLSREESLSYMVRDFQTLRLVGIPDLFEALCWAVTGQQINLKFAYTLKRRLVERFGRKIIFGDTSYYLFPSPDVLAAADPGELRQMQFSTSKIQYIRNISQAFIEGTISKAGLLELSDLTLRQKSLTAIGGVGIWTANYALMKSLKERSCIPYGDAGLLNALIAHKLIQGKSDRYGLNELFARFEGWESYLVFYLWRSLSPRPDRD